MVFNSIQEFRDKATDADKQTLADYLNAAPKKSEAIPNETYNFSYSSASTYLREEGYTVGRGSSSVREDLGAASFMISKFDASAPATSRSFVVTNDILSRLDKLSSEYGQYSKKAIINKLLDDALRKYGF